MCNSKQMSTIIMDLLKKILIFAVILLYSESLVVARVPPPCSRFPRSAPSSDSVQSYPDDELCCIDCEQPNRLCLLLRSPNNGVVRVNNGRATYTCNNGYRLFGSYSRFCLSSGSWSGSNPSCQLISRVCPVLNNPSNGQVSVSSHVIGGTATYSCNTGYGLSGSSSRTCLSSCNWSGSNPSCQLISIWTCPVPIIPSNGQVSVNSYLIGGIATYSCNIGYRLSGSFSRTCLRGCKWSGSDPSCQLIAENCPVLNNPSNGRVSVSSYVIGGRAIYSCNIGYRLSGSSSRTCSSSGSWSGSNPSCQRMCPTLNNPSNGRVSVSSYFEEGIAIYSCNTGYGLSGSSFRTCSFSGSWSGSNPSCLGRGGGGGGGNSIEEQFQKII
ncbi:sushi, von Willebrand factor type A, EGF and pentraxin domain-containing protein 1-like [Halichondria panicea]|uniref:sushi, von Willebrand factor type A, EGF and pentraxin domain-containing protein 1-like n=1 Tax=Halichondria panicea TaxID=6063 RepID=UPI00312B4978